MTNGSLPTLVSGYIHGVMPSMHGWCHPAKAEALAMTILEVKPEIAVEIGVYAGRSLIVIALAMHTNGFGRVIGIDPWDANASIAGFEHDEANRKWWADCPHDAIYSDCVRYIREMGVERYIDLVRGTSEQAAIGFRLTHRINREQPFIQFLHIDGNHSEASALFDVRTYVPMVEKGGVVCFDDVNWNTTNAAQKELLESCDQFEHVESDGQACAFFRKR